MINLDGKVNRDAFFALKEDNLTGYLKDEGIDVVIDHCKIMDLFLGIKPGTMESTCTRVTLDSFYPGCVWYAYRRPILALPDSSAPTRTLQESE